MSEQNIDLRRKHERKIYKNDIVFSYKNHVYAGTIKNISLGGAFIATRTVNQFSVGDVITLSIPFTNGEKHVKRKARIEWHNNEGFAVEFF